MISITPLQWHIYIVALDPRVGTKPGKQRPCLAIQPSPFGQSGLNSTVILPITSKVSGEAAYPLRIPLPKGLGGLDQPSEVMIDQILAWDNSLFRKELGPLPEALRETIKAALREFLDLDTRH